MTYPALPEPAPLGLGPGGARGGDGWGTGTSLPGLPSRAGVGLTFPNPGRPRLRVQAACLPKARVGDLRPLSAPPASPLVEPAPAPVRPSRCLAGVEAPAPTFFPLPREGLLLTLPAEVTSRPAPDICTPRDLSQPILPPAAFQLLFPQPAPFPRPCAPSSSPPESQEAAPTTLTASPTPQRASAGNADCVTPALGRARATFAP